MKIRRIICCLLIFAMAFGGYFAAAATLDENLEPIAPTVPGYSECSKIYGLNGRWLAKKHVGDKAIYVVDNSGNIVLDLSNYRECRELHNGRMVVASKDWKVGFLDREFNLVIQCKYMDVDPFENNISNVKEYEGGYYCIDIYGNTVTPVSYAPYKQVAIRGTECILETNSYYGVVDSKSGKTMIPFKDKQEVYFYGDKEYLVKNDDCWNVVDKKGNKTPISIGYHFFRPGNIVNNVLPTNILWYWQRGTGKSLNGEDLEVSRYGLLDSKFQPIMDPILDPGAEGEWLYFNDEGFAKVMIAGPIWQKTYFPKGGIVSNGTFGVIDRYGKWVIQPTNYDFKYLDYGRFIIKTPTAWKIVDHNGKVISLLKKEIDIENYLKSYVDDWAVPELTRSVQKGLFPRKWLENCSIAITREEFCRFLVMMLGEKGVQLPDAVTRSFEDTASEDVEIASMLGIVKGKGEGVFEPYDHITRQEAATMLYRAAKVLGYSFTENLNSFADDASIGDWAKESVYAMNELKVMMGVDGNRFDPNGTYTKEQSIATILRLYETKE